MEEKKTCRTCGETKHVESFGRDSRSKSGRRATCKTCRMNKRDPKRHAERQAKYWRAHRDEILAKEKEKRAKNPGFVYPSALEWRKKNAEKLREIARNNYYKNRERRKDQAKERYYADHEESKRKMRERSHKQCKAKKALAARRYHLMASYGMTIEDYDHMILDQCGRCAICGEYLGAAKKPHPVDHDHAKTGRASVRGIVHAECNTIVGIIESRQDLLRKAEIYVLNHSLASAENSSGLREHKEAVDGSGNGPVRPAPETGGDR